MDWKKFLGLNKSKIIWMLLNFPLAMGITLKPSAIIMTLRKTFGSGIGLWPYTWPIVGTLTSYVLGLILFYIQDRLPNKRRFFILVSVLYGLFYFGILFIWFMAFGVNWP